MQLYFSTSMVPDIEKYQNSALNRSGNNALEGIAMSLWSRVDCEIESCIPIASFPRGKIWIPGCTERYPNGMIVKMLPTFNIKIFKNLYWGVVSFFHILRWHRRHKKEKCVVLVYNFYSASISALYLACKLTGSKLFAILYDLGIPPKRLGLSKSTMLAYHVSELSAKFFIKRLDGRIVINELMVHHYAPTKHFLLIDGGINTNIIQNLFPLRVSNKSDYVFVCAGMLWDQNGTKLILDALKLFPSLTLKVLFAGRGNDVSKIEEAAKNDNRIYYLGMLTTDKLFKVYEQADVLLNLRIEEEVDFHFPSKLLEYLATGKYVISTPIAHAERDYGNIMGILKDVTPKGLAEMMKETMRLGKRKLYDIGKTARDFILAYRTWSYRTEEILNYIEDVTRNNAE